jgi:hypothetical protein
MNSRISPDHTTIGSPERAGSRRASETDLSPFDSLRASYEKCIRHGGEKGRETELENHILS